MQAIVGILKKILVPLIAFVVTVVLGVGLLLSGLLPFSLQLSTADDGSTAVAAEPEPTPTPLPYFQPPNELLELGGGIFYETGQRVVNLADPGGYRFLRISIVLEFLPDSPDFYTLTGEKRTAAEEAFRAEVDRQRPIIDNVLTDVLTSKTFDEVFTVEGKAKLREEIREELNRRLRNRYVQQVLFTDFVIQ